MIGIKVYACVLLMLGLWVFSTLGLFSRADNPRRINHHGNELFELRIGENRSKIIEALGQDYDADSFGNGGEMILYSDTALFLEVDEKGQLITVFVQRQ